MAINESALGLTVNADQGIRATRELSGQMRGLETATGLTERSLSVLNKTATALGVTFAAATFLRKFATESTEAQNAMAQLEAGVRSTGGAAGFTATQLAEMATQMQDLTTYSDDAIARTQALLLTFTKIRGDEFVGATEAIANMASRLGGLEGAALQVGKALNDPILGVTALNRAGVQFTESQKEQIKVLQESGNLIGAQRIILKELETQFGGSAAAARDTLGGALAHLSNKFGDLFEVTRSQSGGAIAAIDLLANNLDKLVEAGKLVAVVFGARMLAGGITSLTQYTAATSLATVATRGLTTAMNLVGGPVGLAVIALYGLYKILDDSGQKAAELAERNERVRKSIEGYTSEIANATRATLEAAAAEKQLEVNTLGTAAAIAYVKSLRANEKLDVGFIGKRSATDQLDAIRADKQLQDVLELQAKAKGELLAVQGRLNPLVAAEGQLADDIKKSNEERNRLSQQAFALARLEGVQAAHLAVEHKRVNELVKAQAAEGGKVSAATRTSIESEAALGHKIVEINAFRQRGLEISKLIADSMRELKRLADEQAEKELQRQKNGAELVKHYQEQLRLSRQAEEASKLTGTAREQLLVKQRTENELLAVRDALARGQVSLTKEQLEQIERVIKATGDSGLQIIYNNGLLQVQKKIVEDTAGVMAEGFAQALSASSGLLAVLGESGREMSKLAQFAAQFATNLARAQQIKSLPDDAGKTTTVGFLGGLTGKGGAAGVATAVSSALGMVGAVVAIGDALDIFGNKAKQRAREMAEAARQFNRALEDFAIFQGSELDRALEDNLRKAEELASLAHKAGGLTGSGRNPDFDSRDDVVRAIEFARRALESATSGSVTGRVPGLEKYLAALEEVLAAIDANAEILRERAEREAARAKEDLQVRFLRATLGDEAADQLRFEIEQQRELEDARTAQRDATYIAMLEEVHLVEARRRAAEIAREAARAMQDLSVRLFAASGASDEEVAAMRFAIQQQQEYEDAVLAGRDAAYLAKLAQVQLAEAEAFAQAQAEAAAEKARQLAEDNLRFTESLTVRGLRALGNDRGAEDAERAASNRQELADAIASGMSETNIALLQFVQFMERAQVEMQRAIEDGTKAIREQEAADLKRVDNEIAAQKLIAEAIQKQFALDIENAQKRGEEEQKRIDVLIEAQQDMLGVAKEQLQAAQSAVSVTERVLESLKSFNSSLPLGNLTTLSPLQQAAEARRQFDDLAARALRGDKDAAGGLGGAATAFLEASRAVNASGVNYAADFNRVREIVAAVTAQFGNTLTAEQAALAAAQSTVAGIEREIELLREAKEVAQESSRAEVEAIKVAQQAAKDASDAVLAALQAEKDAITAQAEADIAELIRVQEGIFNLTVTSHEGWTAFQESAGLQLSEDQSYHADARNYFAESLARMESNVVVVQEGFRQEVAEVRGMRAEMQEMVSELRKIRQGQE